MLWFWLNDSLLIRSEIKRAPFLIHLSIKRCVGEQFRPLLLRTTVGGHHSGVLVHALQLSETKVQTFSNDALSLAPIALCLLEVLNPKFHWLLSPLTFMLPT
jgi:hypothetical protein